MPVPAVLGVLVATVVAVVGALVLTEPGPGGGASHWASAPKGKPVATGAASEGVIPVGRSETGSGLAGLPAAERPPTTTVPTTAFTTADGVVPTSANAAGPVTAVTPTAGSVPPVTGPTAAPAPGDLGPSAAITMVLAASGEATSAHVEWTVTGGEAQIAGFELVWWCCGARQGSTQLAGPVRSHHIGNLAPGTSYVVQLSAVRHDGTVDVASVTTAPFTTATVATWPTTTVPAPAPKPVHNPIIDTPVTPAPATTVPVTAPPTSPVPDRTSPGLLPRLIDRILLGGASDEARAAAQDQPPS